MLHTPQTSQSVTAPLPRAARPAPPAPTDFTIRLRPAAWTDLRKRTNLDTDKALADALKLNRSTVCRVMTGTAEPGATFIAHTLATFRFASFDKLFEWVAK